MRVNLTLLTCKGCVHGIVGQNLAVDAVGGGGGDGSNHVGGVDVLDVTVALHNRNMFDSCRRQQIIAERRNLAVVT
jgi:hypothetical protein